MQKALVECVPNFSEGRDLTIIKQITDEIESVEGVRLLDVDPGKATNRTVVTFVGEPQYVIEAAFRGIKKAAELIDMSRHTGEHPRMGATDVCPLIPVSGISMEETAAYAQKLAQRVAEELEIPTYLYEYAQTREYRKNLSIIRAGEYEGFFDKIKQPEWQPDFGKAQMNAKAGATVIGARDFLIAYNVNLNTKSVRIANRIAFDVREAGRVKREGNPYTGKIAKDENGEEIRIPGKLKHVKGMGWFIEEYNRAQISMNLTNYKETPLHTVFEETRKSADSRGVRVTGSELVGLIPLEPMLSAGKYFLELQGSSVGASEEELVEIAVQSLGLNELGAFDPKKKIIEYVLKEVAAEKLVQLSVKRFCSETASDSPAPGGGSVAALSGALAASLGAMVANLSCVKKGWEERVAEFSPWAEKGQKLKEELLFLIDEDTRAFNGIMTAFGLPKDTPEQKAKRKEAIETASQYATETPYRTLQATANTLPLLEAMIEKGNPNSLSDAGVGVACAKTAMQGAWFNVLINTAGLADRTWAEAMNKQARELFEKANSQCDLLLLSVEKRLQSSDSE